MWRPSLGRLAAAAVFLYAGHALWTLSGLFSTPSCVRPSRCLSSRLAAQPHDLAVFAGAPRSVPDLVFDTKFFDPNKPFSRVIDLKIPQKTRKNGTMFLYVGVASSATGQLRWEDVKAEGAIEKIPLVTYKPPPIAAFNLLGDEAPVHKSDTDDRRPVSHLKTMISFSVLADPIMIPANQLPGELLDHIRITYDDQYLPIIQYNFLKNKLSDLIELKKDTYSVNVTIDYVPASIGKMKFLAHISLAMRSLKTMGFSEKDIDDVKGLFADTNLYLLCATVIISSFHMLFDFLAFKNDISFWRAKRSMAGLSMRTVLWRAFSQTVITLYLIDENTSLLVLIPAGIGTLIELWKVKKILHIEFDWQNSWWPKIVAKADEINKAEEKTRAVDAEAMRYLSYVLYPICVCGAVYSLIYQPHKSWYSWTLNSVVNGVYAFGFLFMLPQLFINYKMKSVAALPWRAFMYKAFNTFIDDVFAFIITMPVAHRVACFRDDIVFIIYLYQRWLYPVDINRVDESYAIEETLDETHKKQN